MVDPRNADAKARLLAELVPMRSLFTVETEQEVGDGALYVARIAHNHVRGHVTVEASGYRKQGGYEYLVSRYDDAGGILRGPLSFSYPSHAVYWARRWLLDE
jgi:hypothetical protein